MNLMRLRSIAVFSAAILLSQTTNAQPFVEFDPYYNMISYGRGFIAADTGKLIITGHIDYDFETTWDESDWGVIDVHLWPHELEGEPATETVPPPCNGTVFFDFIIDVEPMTLTTGLVIITARSEADDPEDFAILDSAFLGEPLDLSVGMCDIETIQHPTEASQENIRFQPGYSNNTDEVFYEMVLELRTAGGVWVEVDSHVVDENSTGLELFEYEGAEKAWKNQLGTYVWRLRLWTEGRGAVLAEDTNHVPGGLGG